MGSRQFDRVTLSFNAPATRRWMLGRLAVLPVLQGLLALLDPTGTAADGRRRRRKKAHKHGRPRRHGSRKNDRNSCKPSTIARICAGKCGPVENNHCRKIIDCGPCPCGGVICDTDQICDDETCQPCDVCPTCAHTTIQDAIDAATSGDTIRICAGTYTRSQANSVASIIDKDLTLVGAGAGASIMDGAGVFTANPVLLCDQTTTTVRQLTVMGSDGKSGIQILASSTVTFANVTVTQNTTNNGGGILNAGTVILAAGTRVTGNPVGTHGGGIFNAGSLTLREGSSVTDNLADKRGGGIYNSGGSVTLQAGSRVTGNTANIFGGGEIFSSGGSVTLEAGSLVCGNSEPQCVGFPPPGGFCGACP
jgi:hypothetical protein